MPNGQAFYGPNVASRLSALPLRRKPGQRASGGARAAGLQLVHRAAQLRTDPSGSLVDEHLGVGGSSGTTADTIGQMARDAIVFMTAVGCGQVDLLGFSIGSPVAQEIAPIRPAIVRRVVLASWAPQGGAGMHGWAPAVMDAVGKPEVSAEDYLKVFFAPSPASRKAGQETVQRQYARTEDRDTPTTWATREAQYDAVCTWGIPDHAALQRVAAIEHPVFVANGDSDPMILPHYSYLLAGLIP